MRVGDRIRIKESGTRYDYTRPGSEGIIAGIDSNHFLVKFYKVTGDERQNETWSVRKIDCKIVG